MFAAERGAGFCARERRSAGSSLCVEFVIVSETRLAAGIGVRVGEWLSRKPGDHPGQSPEVGGKPAQSEQVRKPGAPGGSRGRTRRAC